MKEQLLAFTLLATSGLMAQEGTAEMTEPQNYAQNDCCDPCGDPCCVPKPKKCITCQCYTPPFYDLQCDWGAFLSVEFLYWYGRETNHSYALTVSSTPAGLSGGKDYVILAPTKGEYIKAKWDPGFRIGLGWNSECDGWDWYLNWTYYRNRSSSSSSVPTDYNVDGQPSVPDVGQSALLNPWFNIALIDDFVTPLTFDVIKGKRKFTVNWIDLELGRKYWLSRCFNLRPYAAIRGGWTKVDFRVRSSRDALIADSAAPTPCLLSFKDRHTNRNWGVGILGGLQPTWYFCSNFALYSNFDIALLWGEREEKIRQRYNIQNEAVLVTDYTNRFKGRLFGMQTILDVAIGLRWEESWCCDRYRTSLDLGWEHHDWINHARRTKFLSQEPVFDGVDDGFVYSGFSGVTEEIGDLEMGGFVARLRFDF